mmetsp:Transcript_107844/g.348045  ORF Transcript_107844/g.348045 Transcript_107844/m.348045 type:complete len:253 (-) Transcript_107844:781-1539(-)
MDKLGAKRSGVGLPPAKHAKTSQQNSPSFESLTLIGAKDAAPFSPFSPEEAAAPPDDREVPAAPSAEGITSSSSSSSSSSSPLEEESEASSSSSPSSAESSEESSLSSVSSASGVVPAGAGATPAGFGVAFAAVGGGAAASPTMPGVGATAGIDWDLGVTTGVTAGVTAGFNTSPATTVSEPGCFFLFLVGGSSGGGISPAGLLLAIAGSRGGGIPAATCAPRAAAADRADSGPTEEAACGGAPGRAGSASP